MADIFEEAGVEVTPQNRKDVDRKIHEIVGVTYKDCPATWRKVEEMKAEAAGRDELISRLKT
jgi:molecular chaperone GrpE (heat shock protein)